MLKFTMLAFGIGWILLLAVATGLIGHDSKLGFGPLILLMMSTMTGLTGLEDEEQRVPLLLLAAASFGSCMLYGVLRYFMLFALAGRQAGA